MHKRMDGFVESVDIKIPKLCKITILFSGVIVPKAMAKWRKIQKADANASAFCVG